MASVATLPILETMGSVVEITLTFVYIHFFASGIQLNCRKFVCLHIQNVQHIGKIGRHIKFAGSKHHFSRAVTQQGNTATQSVQEVQVVFQSRLVGIGQQFLQHGLVVNHADIMRSRMRYIKFFLVAGDAPDAGSAPFRFVNDNRPQKGLLFHVYHTEGAGVHPSLVQL